VVAVPGVDAVEPPLPVPLVVPEALLLDVVPPPGVKLVPGGTMFVVPEPVVPLDGGRAPVGPTMVAGLAGTSLEPGVVVPAPGTLVSGGTIVRGGAATRGVTISLFSTQSGPLRSMHTGFASKTL